MGLNMYNPLQAKRSWGYKITTTLSELRSSSISYHINHSSDKKGRKDEGMKGRKVQATSISSWLTCLLPVACCLLAHNGEGTKGRKVQETNIFFMACLPVACCLLPSSFTVHTKEGEWTKARKDERYKQREFSRCLPACCLITM
jgi:hypothetical protein